MSISDSSDVSKMSLGSSNLSLSQTQSASQDVTTTEEKVTLNILKGKFFQVVAIDSQNFKSSFKVAARCQTCSAVIKGEGNSSSNFVRHLKVSVCF